MKPLHAIALALVGWYLMIPPSAGNLDGACNGKSFFWNVVGTLSTQEHLNSETAMCNRESHRLVANAPLSKWKRAGFDETLAECQARYEEHQKAPPNGQLMAKLELKDEGKANPSDEELKSRADSLTRFLKAQIAAEKCVASDDPRLKEK